MVLHAISERLRKAWDSGLYMLLQWNIRGDRNESGEGAHHSPAGTRDKKNSTCWWLRPRGE